MGVGSVFDVNINPVAARVRATSIFGEAGKSEVEGLDSFGEICGLSAEAKAQIVGGTLASVRHWRAFAKRNGCKDSECDLMGRDRGAARLSNAICQVAAMKEKGARTMRAAFSAFDPDIGEP